MEAFQSHLENTLFKTDQDNFYRVSTVISKLCEEEKIDVIGCKTKANLQPLPRRRAMTVISPGCQMSGPRCRGRRRGAHHVTLAQSESEALLKIGCPVGEGSRMHDPRATVAAQAIVVVLPTRHCRGDSVSESPPRVGRAIGAAACWDHR